MSVVIPDVEQELLLRITPLQPVLAPRLAKRLATLPSSDVAAMLSSQDALIRSIEWAIMQDLSQPAPMTFVPTLPTVPTVPTVPAVQYMQPVQPVQPLYTVGCCFQQPMPVSNVVASPVVSPRPGYRQVPAGRSLSPLPTVPRNLLANPPWGLEEFLNELNLSHYSMQANSWAATMGAVFLEDMLEDMGELANALGLRPFERSRLFREGPQVAARLQLMRSRDFAFHRPVRQASVPPVGHRW